MNNQRVIKFRVWDSYAKRYVKPDEPHNFCQYYDFNTGEFRSWDSYYNGYGKPWQIQQFTGLQYLNGRDVYEGDILNTKPARWQVIFENGTFVGKVVASNSFDLGYTLPLSAIIEHAIPMGNVCENPELVKAE